MTGWDKMARGRPRLLTDEEERLLVAEVALRRTLSDKCLARRYGLRLDSMKHILKRLRERAMEKPPQKGVLSGA